MRLPWGGLGDPRPGVALRPDGRPDIDWVEIPAGPFIMGSDDDEARDGEKPAHTIQLPAYRIGRYPITNAQYRPFVGFFVDLCEA